MRVLIGAAILIAGVSFSGLAQQPGAGTVPVGTVQAERRPITKTADFVGRVQAIDRVDITARITGYLEAVVFKEGDVVKEGAPLYRIEKGLFQASVQQAQGALAADKAKKLLTEVQLKRAEYLAQTSTGTVVTRDQALTADRSADAQLLVDQANVNTAQINLGYTDITAPVAGKIGRNMLTKGNVVSPQSGTLTTIVSQSPMYVLFPVSQREFLQVRQQNRSVDIAAIKAKLRFADGSTYDQVGRLNFVDVTVDRSTDTVQVRAAFPNPTGALVDGQLVNVNLEAGTPAERVVVPQAALLTDQQGVYVFVAEDGKAAIRRIKTAGASGENMVVTDGLSGGEQVIVEGLQALRPGIAVRAAPAAPALNQG